MYRAFRPVYLDSDHFRANVSKSPLVLDGGSKGSLFEPFSAVTKGIDVLAFDPDPNDVQYNVANGKVRFLNRALWSAPGMIDVHLAVDRSTSSVYPPNEQLLRQFPDYIAWPVRKTERVIRVESTSVDTAVAEGLCETPDFIKLDIHSAEFEALEGSRHSLAHCVGVQVETWHSPIHTGQHLHAEVENLLNRQGFSLFNFSAVMSWKRTVDGVEFLYDQSQVVGSESLYFRDYALNASVSQRTALIAIGCADLYRYTAYAIQLSRRFLASGVFSAGFQQDVESELRAIERARRRNLTFTRTNLRRLANRVIGKVATAFPPR